MTDGSTMIETLLTKTGLIIRDSSGDLYYCRHIGLSKDDGLATLAPVLSPKHNSVSVTVPRDIRLACQNAYRRVGITIPIVVNNDTCYTLDGGMII